MAMWTRKQREKQEDIWIAHAELATAPGHPFYQRLNELLEAEGFDQFVEQRCAKFYAEKYGRPSLTPGIYFRSLLIGYFEGIGAERGIAWRLADSLARLDRKRKKRTSNKEWKSPADEDARIAKMKDGRTHLAHKAEHAVDLDGRGGGGHAARSGQGRHHDAR